MHIPGSEQSKPKDVYVCEAGGSEGGSEVRLWLRVLSPKCTTLLASML